MPGRLPSAYPNPYGAPVVGPQGPAGPTGPVGPAGPNLFASHAVADGVDVPGATGGGPWTDVATLLVNVVSPGGGMLHFWASAAGGLYSAPGTVILRWELDGNPVGSPAADAGNHVANEILNFVPMGYVGVTPGAHTLKLRAQCKPASDATNAFINKGAIALVREVGPLSSFPTDTGKP